MQLTKKSTLFVSRQEIIEAINYKKSHTCTLHLEVWVEHQRVRPAA